MAKARDMVEQQVAVTKVKMHALAEVQGLLLRVARRQ